VVKVLDADLSITGTGPPTALSGVPVTYTLTVHNSGPTEAPGVAVVDQLPARLVATSFVVTPDVGTCNGTSTVVCQFPDALASGATATITITAVGRPSAGTLINTATISGTASDFNAANNTAALALQVLAPAPTLSHWMLFALVAALLAIAMFRTR
jgi:uncharacterized repeat protein (TIGR01451 family)